MIPATGFSDKDHLNNICKILSLDDYDEEIAYRLYNYARFFGLITSYKDYSEQELLNEKWVVDKVLDEIKLVDIPNARY